MLARVPRPSPSFMVLLPPQAWMITHIAKVTKAKDTRTMYTASSSSSITDRPKDLKTAMEMEMAKTKGLGHLRGRRLRTLGLAEEVRIPQRTYSTYSYN
jgi:hypothetical protein